MNATKPLMHEPRRVRDTLERITQDVITCRACPRLVRHREEVAETKRRAYLAWSYWGKPVPGFGDREAELVLVGLAPGAHGSNRTGRPFTGDASGDFLYPALHRFSFASQSESTSREDGLTLTNCYITAAARCPPPENKPSPAELRSCFPFLVRELRVLRHARVYLALGAVAFDTLRRALPEAGFSIDPARPPRFAHGAEVSVDGGARVLLGSYHPSRQNTQTGRLTRRMFDAVFARAEARLRAG
jgi:uracil-DNA glycosylase family 4